MTALTSTATCRTCGWTVTGPTADREATRHPHATTVRTVTDRSTK